jgi:hypothetical protein
MRRILVTSASGANGDGYGTLLSFSAGGELAGSFSGSGAATALTPSDRRPAITLFQLDPSAQPP